MRDEITITLALDCYINMLELRREKIEKNFNWSIPNFVWDYFIASIEDYGLYGNADPMYIVDNIAVNGDYGDFDMYKRKNESDEAFIKRVQDDVLYINPENREVIFSL
ncbi:MAG: hypothetical protein LUH05_04910 [Candidatus Gastranaerophilales bacterium]|nr:hypothetical protein [Candidatus Gastranaerophilales bacterium]